MEALIPEIKEISDYVSATQLVTYSDVAGATMFVYDYFLTLGMEVDLVWSSNWSLMNVLFIAQRYLPFLDAAVLCFLPQFSTTIAPSHCRILGIIRGLLMVTGIGLSELILTLRAWAVWDRNGRLGAALSVFFCATVAASFVVMTIFLLGLEFSNKPYPSFQGCFITSSNQLVYINWVILMIYEAVLLMLMLIRGIAAYRWGGRSALHRVVYGEGIAFYICIFVLSTLNVVVLNTLSANYLDFLSSVERCLHSILTSRVLLHIRVCIRRNVEFPAWSGDMTKIETRIRFADGDRGSGNNGVVGRC